MRKTAFAALCFALGVAAVEYSRDWLSYVSAAEWLLPALALALISAAAVLFVLRRRGAQRVSPFLCLFALAAGLGILRMAAADFVSLRPAYSLAGRRLEASGVALDYPTEYTYGARVELKLERPVRGAKVLLWLDLVADVKPGDTFSFTADFELPESGGSFDYLAFYRSQRVFLNAEPVGGIEVERGDGSGLFVVAADIRRAISDGLCRVFEEGDARGLALALICGDRTGIDDTLRASLSMTGLSHLVSVSGLHVSIVTGLSLALFRTRRARRRMLLPAILLAFGYALVTGFAPSAARACIMCAVVLLAEFFGRDADPLTSLSMALAGILLFNPYGIADVGLQLSFLATLALVLFSDKCAAALLRLVRANPEARPRNRLHAAAIRLRLGAARTVAATLSATAVTLPLTAALFRSVSTLAIFTNLLVIPLLAPLLALGLVCAALSLLPLPVEVVAEPLRLGLEIVAQVARRAARLPFSALDPTDTPVTLLLIFVYALLALKFVTHRFPALKLRVPAGAVAIAVAAALPVCLATLTFSRFSAPLDIRVLDVGQGQCILISSRGRTVLVDCGGDRYGGAGAYSAQALKAAGVRSLDLLVLTHCHDDHAGGVADLLKMTDVRRVILPRTEGAYEVVDLLYEHGVETEIAGRGIQLELGELVATLFLPNTGAEENESGLCVSIAAEGFRTVITGDLPAYYECVYARDAALERVDLLVAGHHGSASSTNSVFLGYTEPRYAAISVGADNPYGHPAAETLERLEAAGCEVLRTDEMGDLRFRINLLGRLTVSQERRD